MREVQSREIGSNITNQKPRLVRPKGVVDRANTHSLYAINIRHELYISGTHDTTINTAVRVRRINSITIPRQEKQVTQARDRHRAGAVLIECQVRGRVAARTHNEYPYVDLSTIYRCGINFCSTLASRELGLVDRIALKTIPSASPPPPPPARHQYVPCMAKRKGVHNTTHVSLPTFYGYTCCIPGMLDSRGYV